MKDRSDDPSHHERTLYHGATSRSMCLFRDHRSIASISRICIFSLRFSCYAREREMFYLTTHSTHFIYGYMASDIWLRTILIMRKETRCRHIGYSYRLAARVLLYAPSHRQDNTYHGLCYTSRGALAGTRNSSMGPPHDSCYACYMLCFGSLYHRVFRQSVLSSAMAYKVARCLFIDIFNADTRPVDVCYQLMVCFQCCSVCIDV